MPTAEEIDRACAAARAALQGNPAADVDALLSPLLALAPDHFELNYLMGAAAAGRGDFRAAEPRLARAVEIGPAAVDALNALGVTWRALGRGKAALALYDRALAADARRADILANRANLLADLRRFSEALETCDRALALQPGAASVLNIRGNALSGLGRAGAALAAYDQALAARPAFHNALVNRGNALMDLGRAAEALASYDRALALEPASVAALVVRGNALSRLRRWDEARQAYDAAFAAGPNHPYLAGVRLHARMKICAWESLDEEVAHISDGLRAGARVSVPFALFATPLGPDRLKQAAEIFAADQHGAVAPAPPVRAAGERLRIAYVSADFHNHATAYLLAELIELHDRAGFEVIGLSYGPASQDEMRRRLEAGFDRFVEVGGMADTEVAALARQMGVDIAVDLKGFTTGARPGIFAARAAPVQASFLGFPCTTGAPFIDYLVADRELIGPRESVHYSEQIVWMPGSYQVNDRTRPLPAGADIRAHHGLPPEGFVFCCFNNSYKITPEVFAIWMRLLLATPGSVLWLYEDNPAASENLRVHARAHGLDPDRLVFAGHQPIAGHLARQRHADLFLDTFHCNAHTTASDALWAGVPVVTLRGETFVGRVAASLLRAAGLADLITDTAEDYEALALGLARDAARLKAVRDRVSAARTTSALYDTPAFTRGLEWAFRAMQARAEAGQPPGPISVP